MERKKICLTPAASSPLVGSNVHVAGGSNAGIIVNKQQIGDEGIKTFDTLTLFMISVKIRLFGQTNQYGNITLFFQRVLLTRFPRTFV